MTRKRLAATCLVVIAVLAGCGDDGNDDSANDRPEVCSDVDGLQESVQALRDTTVEPGALDTIRGEVDELRAGLAELGDDARDEYATEIDGVTDAVNTARDAVTAAVETPSAETLTLVRPALAGIGDAMDVLESAVAGTC